MEKWVKATLAFLASAKKLRGDDMEHTKGPWTVSANVDGLVHQRNDPHDIVVDLTWPQLMVATERDANARLIAAAPALLEALEDMVKIHPGGTEGDMCVGTQCLCNKARAAILAAKGD